MSGNQVSSIILVTVYIYTGICHRIKCPILPTVNKFLPLIFLHWVSWHDYNLPDHTASSQTLLINLKIFLWHRVLVKTVLKSWFPALCLQLSAFVVFLNAKGIGNQKAIYMQIQIVLQHSLEGGIVFHTLKHCLEYTVTFALHIKNLQGKYLMPHHSFHYWGWTSAWITLTFWYTRLVNTGEKLV